MTRQPYRRLSRLARRVQYARCWVRANWLFCAVYKNACVKFARTFLKMTANAAWLYMVMVGVGR